MQAASNVTTRLRGIPLLRKDEQQVDLEERGGLADQSTPHRSLQPEVPWRATLGPRRGLWLLDLQKVVRPAPELDLAWVLNGGDANLSYVRQYRNTDRPGRAVHSFSPRKRF